MDALQSKRPPLLGSLIKRPAALGTDFPDLHRFDDLGDATDRQDPHVVAAYQLDPQRAKIPSSPADDLP